jgi:hypothetical protein
MGRVNLTSLTSLTPPKATVEIAASSINLHNVVIKYRVVLVYPNHQLVVIH